MKKSFLIKLYILIAVIVLTAVVPITTYAKVPKAKWTINAERTEITDGFTVYYAYDLPKKYTINHIPKRILQQGSMLKIHVVSYGENSGILFSNRKKKYYVTEETNERLASYFSGERGVYYLMEYGKMGMQYDELADFSATYPNKYKCTFDLSELYGKIDKYVLFVDDTHTLGTVKGEFYLIRDKYYYVDLEYVPEEIKTKDGFIDTSKPGKADLIELTHQQKENYLAAKSKLPEYEGTVHFY